MNFVFSKNEELCIKNEKFCISNDEFSAVPSLFDLLEAEPAKSPFLFIYVEMTPFFNRK